MSSVRFKVVLAGRADHVSCMCCLFVISCKAKSMTYLAQKNARKAQSSCLMLVDVPECFQSLNQDLGSRKMPVEFASHIKKCKLHIKVSECIGFPNCN